MVDVAQDPLFGPAAFPFRLFSPFAKPEQPRTWKSRNVEMRTLRYELSPTARYFDRALRTVKEYLEAAEYIPMNPVRRG